MKDYYKICSNNLGKGGRIPVDILGNSQAVFEKLALEMVEEIQNNNITGKNTVFICPVGPVGQYPVFAKTVNRRRISLKNVWFFNMDEYLTDDREWISKDDALSFRKFMKDKVYDKIDKELLMPEEQRVFPDPAVPDAFDRRLEELGGADICFGGIGITGHIAFNEPESVPDDEFLKRPTRIVKIAEATRTTGAIGELGGALEDMPGYAVTIGMKQIYSAGKIRLGVFRDWHRAVLRRAVYGDITAEFPVTLLQRHSDIKIYANDIAAGDI